MAELCAECLYLSFVWWKPLNSQACRHPKQCLFVCCSGAVKQYVEQTHVLHSPGKFLLCQDATSGLQRDHPALLRRLLRHSVWLCLLFLGKTWEQPYFQLEACHPVTTMVGQRRVRRTDPNRHLLSDRPHIALRTDCSHFWERQVAAFSMMVTLLVEYWTRGVCSLVVYLWVALCTESAVLQQTGCTASGQVLRPF